MSTIKTNAILDASGGNTTTINGATPTAYNTMGKNRIINGAMEIDQRNAGGAVTTNSSFAVDRWVNIDSLSTGAFSAQQIPYSTVPPPAGFAYSVRWTVTTAEASPSSGNSHIRQLIEGYNVSDTAFGTADAKNITVSFWCRSSVTGTHSGSLRNHDGSRSYPFSFTISSADTWTYVTKTIPGDTAGSWNVFANLNSAAIILSFNMGSESAKLGTANSWASTNYVGTTGSVQLCETLNATFYITGVQLEVGSVATEFERRPYGIELMLCERYYQKYTGNTTSYPLFGVGHAYSSNQVMGVSKGLTTNMRAYPTASLTGTWYARRYDASSDVLNNPTIAVSTNFVSINGERNNSGLTAGHACTVWSETGSLILSAEL